MTVLRYATYIVCNVDTPLSHFQRGFDKLSNSILFASYFFAGGRVSASGGLIAVLVSVGVRKNLLRCTELTVGNCGGNEKIK